MGQSPYEKFPHIITGDVIIRKMIDSDLAPLFEICSNDNVYKYTSTFLYTKNQSALTTARKK